MDGEFKMAMPFFEDSEDFTLGFEAGRLWEQTKSEEAFEQSIHKKNKAQAEMICVANKRDYEIVEDDNDTWILLKVKQKIWMN